MEPKWNNYGTTLVHYATTMEPLGTTRGSKGVVNIDNDLPRVTTELPEQSVFTVTRRSSYGFISYSVCTDLNVLLQTARAYYQVSMP